MPAPHGSVVTPPRQVEYRTSKILSWTRHDKACLVQAWRHQRDWKVCGEERWNERDEGSLRHADSTELNGEQKAKELQNNPAAAFVMIEVAYGDWNTDETGRWFRTEVLSTLKRTEMPGRRKMCVWCGRHQDGKEKRQKDNKSRPEKSLQPSGNGGVFP